MTSPGVTALYHANLTGEPVKARTPIAHEYYQGAPNVHLGIAYSANSDIHKFSSPLKRGKGTLAFAFKTGFRVGRQIGSVENALKRDETNGIVPLVVGLPSVKKVRFTQEG
jgi:hypothetical protein